MNAFSVDSGDTGSPIFASASGSLKPNRAERRGIKPVPPVPLRPMWKGAAFVALCAILHTTLPPLHILSAQPFRSFEEHSSADVGRFVDRASRLNDLNAWENYVLTGIAQERVQWEEEAYEALREELLNAEASTDDPDELETLTASLEAQFETARIAWETDASDRFLSERGQYRGEQAVIDATFATEQEYSALIAEVEAQTAADLELDLAGWDSLIGAAGRAVIVTDFENELTADLDAARASFTGDPTERAAFEAQLDQRAAELRQEFEIRDHFYLLRARNEYVARIRADDVSARVIADASSADAIADRVMAQASAELSANTTNMLASAKDQINNLADREMPDANAISSISGDWEKQVENVITAGLRRWDEAEEELYAERLRWQAESERSRAEGEAIWSANHTKLSEAREEWLSEVRAQIAEGRALWEAKFSEFAESRVAAEASLNDFVDAELARRTATMDRLGDMVRGGGSALLQAKEAFAYYDGLLNEMGARNCATPDSSRETVMYCFYQEQRNQTQAAIGNFQRILGESEIVLGDLMHSDANDNGFLNDRRNYAGDLVQVVAGLSAGSFENDLQDEMSSRSEDFLLYKRDLSGIIETNGLFTERATEMQSTNALDFESAGDVTSLRQLVNGLGLKYDDHRRELLALLDVDRSALPDDAARLEAIKADFRTWFTDSQDRNGRLRKVVLDYFQGGAAGYYLSANENDPYYMTAAELEWEQLRRERNYLAKRLQTAEAVKRYADLAESNEAGLELAQVTAERAEIAAVRRDLRELYYLLLKGDLAVDPLVNTYPAVRDSEFARLLSERGISETELFAYETRLGAEQTIVANVLGLSSPPTSGALNSAIADIDTYLTANVPAEQHSTHRMYVLREKLLTLSQEIGGGQSATYITNRWSTITTGLGAVNGELTNLIADYDFNGFRNEFNTVRNAVADPTLTELQAGVTNLRGAIEANAAAVAAANADLQAAQNAYEIARKQNDILRAANSADLINRALLDTTDQLAAVLNRMTALEALPGFDTSRPFNAIDGRRADYLRMVYERESADADYSRSQDLLNAVRGLEDAKVRDANLTTLLGSTGDLSALSAEALADVFLNNESDLLARAAATTEQQSYDRSISHFNELTDVRADLIAARGDLATAVANGDPAENIEILRAVVSSSEARIRELGSLIISNLRGEVGVRISIVQSLLDPGLAPDPDVLAEENATMLAELNQRGLELARDATADLAAFLAVHREQDIATIFAAANDLVAANPLTTRTDGGALALQTEANRAAMRAQLVRQWVLENGALLQAMSTSPVPGDARPVSEKWDELLEGVQQLALGSGFAADFRSGLPTSASDSRIVAIQTARTALLGNLDAVLSAPDGVALVAAYDVLSATDKSTLARYGTVDASGLALRADLRLIRTAIAQDLAALPVNFLSVFLREQSYDAQLVLQQSSRAYVTESSRLTALQSESQALSADILSWQAQIDIEADPVVLNRLIEQRDAAQLRVDALAPRIAALQATVDDLAVNLRDNQFRLREISAPGSSAPLLNNALALVSGEAESAQLLARLQQSAMDYAIEEVPAATELGDQLKTIIGFYATDAAGAIVRDGSNNPVVSVEFQALGITDPNASLEGVLAGGQRGDDLARWSNRLIDWVQNPANTATAPRELLAAAELLALSVQEYRNAVAFIENRDSDPATLAATADLNEAQAAAYLEKLRLLQNLEKRLSDAMEQARVASQDPSAFGAGESPAAAALRILEEPGSQFIFQLFRGYNLKGAPDGLANTELQARADRLRNLAQTLRAGARDAQLLAMADRYARGMEIYIATAQAAADPSSIAPPDRAGFFSSYAELNANPVRATFNAIPDDEGFRTAATEWLRTTGTLAQNVFFREAVLTALGDTVGSGAPLKTAVLNKIDSLLGDINAQLNSYLDEMDFIAQREAYIPAGSVDSDVATALTNLMVATGGMTAEEQARLASELYEQELNRAVQIAANVDYYFAGDYPAELRDFILVQQYAAANERYAQYQAARTSGIPAERDLATLDLRGLTGDYARYILAQDFADYQSAAPAQSVSGAVSAAAADGDSLTLNGYLNQYMQARNLNPALLPDGGEQLLLTIEFQEYKRISADAIAAGGLHLLNESAYAADFAEYVQLAMIEDFVTRNTVTLSGATEAERETEFRAFFENALDDPTYTHGGASLRARLRSSVNMERLFAQAFASMELGGSFPLELNLSASVVGVDPTTALPAPEDLYLPPELLAITGYASADPAAMIAAVSPEYARAFALLESQRALRPADLAPGLYTTDTELDAILARAGFSGATALAAADRTAVHQALRAAIAGSSFAQRGATNAEQALAILRDDRAVAAMAGDTAALANQRVLLASGAIAELDSRADALIASSSLPLAPHRSALARALAESLYVARGAAGAVSPETSAFFAAVPGSQALVDAQIAEAQISAELAGVLLRDAAIVNQYFQLVQANDADRAYVESLFADQSLAAPLARLDLRSDLYIAQAIQARENGRAVAGLFASLADGQQLQRSQEREWISDVETARALREFAGRIHTNPALISFGNYRTFIGAESGAQQAAYQRYLNSSPPDPIDSFEQFHEGRVLSVVSLDENVTTLLAQTPDQWMDRLRSDNPAALGAPVDVDGDGDPGNDPRSVVVQSVSNEALRLAAGSTDNQLRYIFQEALANNYLEAVTRMNAAFTDVFRTASLVGARSAEHSAETVAADALATGYNVLSAAGASDLSGIEALVQNASDRQTANGNAQLQQMRTIARETIAATDTAGAEFADAALRKHIADNGALNYIEETFKPIADNLAAAEAVMNAATAAGDALQDEFAARNSEYVAGLNELSKRFRFFSEASDEFERRQAVKEYAETPYLFASSNVDPEATDGFSADARADYELALQALAGAQQRLDEAALDVRAAARMSDLETLVVGLDAGSVYAPLSAAERSELIDLRDRDGRIDVTLSAAERARFDELRLRETHENYGDVLQARAEHIRHSLRMVRLQKTSELVNAEIERRRSIAEERKRAFDQEMDKTFGSFTEQDQIDARNLVYLRLVSKIGNNAAYFDEFRAWYSLVTPEEDKLPDGNNGDQPRPQNELAAADALANNAAFISTLERDAVKTFFEAGGRLAEYTVFATTYFGYMNALAIQDIAEKELELTKITSGVTIATGISFIAYGIALVAGFFTMFLGWPWIAAGSAMVTAGSLAIHIMQLTYDGRKKEAEDMLQIAKSSAHDASVRKVREKQQAYEEALADLDYFLRAPDLTTAKDRIIEWGKQHPDDKAYGTELAGANLYDLTEDDLKYLFDSAAGPGFYDSDGNVMTLTPEETADKLDVTVLREETVFEDSFGRRFNADPAGLLTTAPGTLKNGVYTSGGTDYIEIKITSPDGSKQTRYAPIVVNPDGVAKDNVFSLGALLDSAVTHGLGLRDQRRDAYLQAGETAITSGNADIGTIIKDRDDAFAELFQIAADRNVGGREFSGYRMVYEEYEQTQREVLERELQQRRDLQTLEWDLRQQELEDRYRLWDKRMQTLLAEGTDHWGRVSDRYLQEWESWNREQDNNTALGIAEWNAKLQDHYTERTAWEQRMNQVAAEKTAEAVLTEAIQELNEQISSTRDAFGLKLESINTTATVNAAIDEIRRSQPASGRLLDSITESVNSFQTRLEISILTGANTGGSVAGVSSKFREEARLHQRRMRTLANVKAAEQYQRMIELFAEQIEVQNDQIENSTKAAAFAAGFALDGAVFTKEAGISKEQASAHKYNRFNTHAVVEEELGKSGIARIVGEELAAFLEEKSDFEVQLYFENQRLATQIVFDRIIGTDPSKRGESRDTTEIGLFGAWVGSAGSSDEKNPVEGFGELGASAEAGRSQAHTYAGFFPELNAAAEELAKADADRLSAASGGPIVQGILGFVNGLNPAMMVMNTATNIQKAVINGKAVGDVIGANLLNMVKQIGMSVGSVLLSMTGVGVGLAAGIMLTMLSSMIQADTTTGEIGFAMTDRDLYSALLAIGGARLGVGLKFLGDKPAKSFKAATDTATAAGKKASLYTRAGSGFVNYGPSIFTGAVQNFGQAGMQFDAAGNYTGFDYNAAAVGAVVGGVSGGAMAKFGLQPYKSGTTRQHFNAEFYQHGITSAVSQTGEVIKAYSGIAPAHLNMMGGDLTALVGMAASAGANRAKYTTGLENYEAPMENVAMRFAQKTLEYGGAARKFFGNRIYRNLSAENQGRLNNIADQSRRATDAIRGFAYGLTGRRQEQATAEAAVNQDHEVVPNANARGDADGEPGYMDRMWAAYENMPTTRQIWNRLPGMGDIGNTINGWLGRGTNTAADVTPPRQAAEAVDGWTQFNKDLDAADWSGSKWDAENITTGDLLRGAGELVYDGVSSLLGKIGSSVSWGLGKIGGAIADFGRFITPDPVRDFFGRQRDKYWEWNNELKSPKDQARYGKVKDSATFEERKGDLLTRDEYLKALKASGGLDNELRNNSGLDETIVNRWNMIVGQRSSAQNEQSGVKAKTSGEISSLFGGQGQEELADFWEERRKDFWKNLDDY